MNNCCIFFSLFGHLITIGYWHLNYQILQFFWYCGHLTWKIYRSYMYFNIRNVTYYDLFGSLRFQCSFKTKSKFAPISIDYHHLHMTRTIDSLFSSSCGFLFVCFFLFLFLFCFVFCLFICFCFVFCLLGSSHIWHFTITLLLYIYFICSPMSNYMFPLARAGKVARVTRWPTAGGRTHCHVTMGRAHGTHTRNTLLVVLVQNHNVC